MDVRYNTIRHASMGPYPSWLESCTLYIEMTMHYYFLGLWSSSSTAGSLTLCHHNDHRCTASAHFHGRCPTSSPTASTCSAIHRISKCPSWRTQFWRLHLTSLCGLLSRHCLWNSLGPFKSIRNDVSRKLECPTTQYSWFVNASKTGKTHFFVFIIVAFDWLDAVRTSPIIIINESFHLVSSLFFRKSFCLLCKKTCNAPLPWML